MDDPRYTAANDRVVTYANERLACTLKAVKLGLSQSGVDYEQRMTNLVGVLEDEYDQSEVRLMLAAALILLIKTEQALTGSTDLTMEI